MSFMMNFVGNERNRFLLQISGSVVLLLFGVYCYRSNPTRNIHKSNKTQKGTLVHNGVTAFLVTLSNPLIIFLFIFLFAQFAFVVPNRPIEMTVGYASIVGGALLWWDALSSSSPSSCSSAPSSIFTSCRIKLIPVSSRNMFISQQLRKKSTAEYVLYMWQVEDIIRAYGCQLSRIKNEYIARFADY